MAALFSSTLSSIITSVVGTGGDAPLLPLDHEKQDKLFEETRRAWPFWKRCLHSGGRFLLLNVLCEELVSDAADPMKRLESVYNLIGLIEALLLSMGITPLGSLKDWARDGAPDFPLSPLQQFCKKMAIYSLLITMGTVRCCVVVSAVTQLPTL